MANAKRDENRNPTLLATSNADGTTPILVKVNPSSQVLMTSDGESGSDLSDAVARRDENRVPVMMGVSSEDGITPVPVYADATTGALLIKTT